MIGPRTVEAEWLDHLPPEDPRAQRSRRDLKNVNAWMFQSHIMCRLFKGQRPVRILELGAGDGEFMLRVARQIAPQMPKVSVTLLDKQDVVQEHVKQGLRDLGWRCETITADVFDFLRQSKSTKFDAITANLFLHHFADDPLKDLLRLASNTTDLFLACEPRRFLIGLAASRLLNVIGCNDVTMHDARASVLAGYKRKEISALWPCRAAWSLEEHSALPFTHVFRAARLP